MKETSTPILSPDQGHSITEIRERAAEVLNAGGLVVFPTETVYGVGALASHDEGLAKLKKLKGREDGKPFSLHMGAVDEIAHYVKLNPGSRLERLVRRMLPGPITMISSVSDAEIEAAMSRLGLPASEGGRVYWNNSLGIRVVDHEQGSAVLSATGHPVVASSANFAGQPAPQTVDMAIESVGDHVDLIVDGGRCRYSGASTIVSLLEDELKIIREGIYDKVYLEKQLKRGMLFVCTGNTCRSPMAEAIAKYELEKAVNAGVPGASDWFVLSAGVYAGPGMPQTPEARVALEELGVPLLHHASRPVSSELMRGVEMVYGMTSRHLDAMSTANPYSEISLLPLDQEAEIVDPIGQSQEVYLECAQQIQEAVRQRLGELGLIVE